MRDSPGDKDSSHSHFVLELGYVLVVVLKLR